MAISYEIIGIVILRVGENHFGFVVGECDGFHKALFERIKRAVSPDKLQKGEKCLDLDEDDEILI